MKTNQVTIYDLARHLNISKSTVSRALSGHPNINSETRRTVLELANKLDYQRNVLSLSLVNKKTFTIGIIAPDFSTSFYPQVVAGAQQEAARTGYNIIVSLSNDDYETEVFNAKMLLTSQVDGVLVSVAKDTQNFDHLKKFYSRGVPVVFFNSSCGEMLAPKVMVNDYDAAFAAVELLIKAGKKSIAHLAGPENMTVNRKRLNGYVDALRNYNMPVRDELIVPYDLSLGKVKIYVNHLIGLDEPADAIFAVNDPAAIEAMKTLKKMGLRVPEDVAVVGFGNYYGADLTEPGLTTINQPGQEMGKTAMRLLIGMINKDMVHWRAVTTALEASLIIRGSSGNLM